MLPDIISQGLLWSVQKTAGAKRQHEIGAQSIGVDWCVFPAYSMHMSTAAAAGMVLPQSHQKSSQRTLHGFFFAQG